MQNWLIIKKYKTKKTMQKTSFKRYFNLSFLVFVAIVFTSCDILNTKIREYDTIRYVANETVYSPLPDTLLFMTWNIKFGGGSINFYDDCHGERVYMDKEETIENLEQIAAKIQETDPDIILIQEIDIESKRSAYINQVQWLLNHTRLNYGVFATEWKGDYVLYNGVQRIKTGNAILSKWDFDAFETFPLPIIEEQTKTEQKFHPTNNVLKAIINTGESGAIALLCTRLSVHSDTTKWKQLKEIELLIHDMQSTNTQFVLAGTFNMLPPGETNLTDFEDVACDGEEAVKYDYSNEKDWLQNLYNISIPAVSLKKYQSNPEKYYSFTSDYTGTWMRKTDHMFSNQSFITETVKVDQMISNDIPINYLSDHTPIIAGIKINN